MNVEIFRPLILCLPLLALAACYEPEQGCLDSRATNFALDADEACDDCCTYPQLRVRFSHRWETADTAFNFQADGVYTDGLGQAFRIQRIRFYWSDISLSRPSGDPLLPRDSILIDYVQGGDTTELMVADNFALAAAGASATTATIGTVQPEGTVVGLGATFGIGEPANSASVTSPEFGSSHPLSPQAGRMNLGADRGYVFAKIELLPDTAVNDTLVLHLFGDAYRRDLQLPLPAATPLLEGFAPRANVTVNYASWFQGVDVRASDTTAMKQQIVNNLTQAFTFTELIVE